MITIFHSITKATLPAAAAVVLASTSPVLAHHSFAMYDNRKEVVLNGVVRDFKWNNPHGEILLTVVERGKPAEYAIEMSSPNVMSRQGWNRKTLKLGERVTITMHPLRDGSKAGSFMRAMKADGKVLGPTAPP